MPLNVFARLMPREEAFTALFCEQTRCIVRAAHELLDLIDHKGPAEAHVSAIRAIEVTADGVARKVFLAANRVFNAPIDREDIIDLANRLDDAVDMIEDTAKAIQRYELTDFPSEMRAIADAGARSADVLHQVMPLLDRITPQHREIFRLCEQVGHIEEEADQRFDAGLAQLRVQLRAKALDTIGYIDRKEIYELLEDVADKCDDIANTVQAITAKHV
jgi:predicted phosphate transport protein (TIGR00153 family)